LDDLMKVDFVTSTKTEAIASAQKTLEQGILSINVSMAVFVVGDTIVKFLGHSFPPNEIIFLRSAAIAVALGLIMLAKGQWPTIKSALAPPILTRCIFDCLNILCFTAAVIHMHIADLYALLLMSPLLMTILAAVFFREPVGYRRWLAVTAGFCGVLMVVKPNPHGLDQWAFVGFLSALGGAVRETVTRRIHPDTPTIEVTFYSAIFAAGGTLIFGWSETWSSLSRPQYLMLLVQAVSWLIGTFLLIQACRLAPLSIVASFRYTLLIWGGLAGYIVFNEIPDLFSFIGAGLIVISGLYTFHREAVRKRVVASDTVTLT
jgi:drug/metabolite transporter (DMT)-like permease